MRSRKGCAKMRIALVCMVLGASSGTPPRLAMISLLWIPCSRAAANSKLAQAVRTRPRCSSGGGIASKALPSRIKVRSNEIVMINESGVPVCCCSVTGAPLRLNILSSKGLADKPPAASYDACACGCEDCSKSALRYGSSAPFSLVWMPLNQPASSATG